MDSSVDSVDFSIVIYFDLYVFVQFKKQENATSWSVKIKRISDD